MKRKNIEVIDEYRLLQPPTHPSVPIPLLHIHVAQYHSQPYSEQPMIGMWVQCYKFKRLPIVILTFLPMSLMCTLYAPICTLRIEDGLTSHNLDTSSCSKTIRKRSYESNNKWKSQSYINTLTSLAEGVIGKCIGDATEMSANKRIFRICLPPPSSRLFN